MSKKLSLLLVVPLLTVPLAAAACGGDDNKAGGSKAVELKQEFRSATGITVKYPDGWVAKDSDSNSVGISNKAEYLDIDAATEMPEDAVVISILPSFDPAGMGLPVPADASVGQILTLMDSFWQHNLVTSPLPEFSRV